MARRVKYLLLVVAFSLALAGCKPETQVATSDSLAQIQAASDLDIRAQAIGIVKEPEYSGTPYYALLVFGAKADIQTWLVVDDKTVYLDRNGNGELTEPGERILLDEKATANAHRGSGEYKGFNVFDLGNIAGHDFVFHVWVLNEVFSPEPDENEILTRYRQGRLANGWAKASLYRTSNGGAQIPVLLCPRSREAQISHIDGPLTYVLTRGEQMKLERDRTLVFDIHIGTPGSATRNSPYPVFANLSTEEVPEHVVPSAVFTFQNKDAGADPIVLNVKLDRRC